MTFPGIKPFVVAVPAVKGAAIAITLTVLDVSFIKSLLIAVVSATITGLFLVVATVITVREARQNREAIHEVREEQRDVKRKLNANNRTTDK